MRYFLIALSVMGTLAAQVASEANKRYQTPEGRAAIATTLNDPHRDDRQKPKELVAALGLKPGMSVADIGTGTGYMLPFLHDAVGDKGHVYGEDIFDDFLRQAKERVENKGYRNVTFIKGTEHTTNLPAHSVNVAMILDAYHHFDFPGEMLESIALGLKKGGRLVLVDFYKRPEAMPGGNAMQHIRIDFDDVVKEVESHGFKFVEKKEQIPGSQYLAIFERPMSK
jgi:ubiquinone/menaquinone biosynthesis C-methylase UbiE